MRQFRFMLLGCMALVAIWAVAQIGETGQITGTVTDPQGAVISGATVTVTNVNRGVSRPSLTTGPDGAYTFTNLEPGTYDVKVTAPGFGPFTQRVQVSVGARLGVNAPLKVQSTGTTITVVGAGGVQVETQTQQQSQVINSQLVTQLPTLTRNPYDLAATAGNVSEGDTQNNTTPRGVGVNVNGQRAASTNILLDGGQNISEFDTTVGQTVPLDSVQEFRLVTSSFDAQYGRATGGVVNVATKSGTNDIHGTLYEFNRNSKFASNTFENVASGVPKGFFNRNQFGATLGGPIKKDKVFFFLSGESLMVHGNSQQIALVPDPAFIGAASPATQAFFAPFHIIPKARLENVFTAGDLTTSATGPQITPGPLLSALPAGTPILDRLSFPVQADSGGGPPQMSYFGVARLDFNLTDKTTAFGRFAYDWENWFNGALVGSFSPWAGFSTGQKVRNLNFLFSTTHIFSPSLVSTSKLLYNRLNLLQPLSSAGVVPTLFFEDGVPTSLFGNFVMNPGYLPTSPGSGIPFGGPQNVGEFDQDFAWTRGMHQVHIGGAFIYTQDNRQFGAYEEASESLGNSGDLTTAFDNFLAGQLFNFQGAVFPQGKFPCKRDPATGDAIVTPDCQVTLPLSPPDFSRSNRYKDANAYVQDSIKLTPRLTVNAGVRWEYYGVQHNVNSNLDSNFYFGQGNNIFDKIANGNVFTVPTSPIKKLWSPDWNNFGPVVGFAYDLTGDGKTSIRGGYRIAYERNFGNVTFNVIQNPPNYAVVSLLSGVDVPTGTNPITLSNFGPLAGTPGLTLALPRTSLRAVRQDIKTAYANQWNFGVERELAANTVLSLEYSGSHGVHDYSIENTNRPGAGLIYGTNPNFTRLQPQYSNINQRGKGGFNYYNGLNIGLRTTGLWKTGFSGSINYTWSHAIDNLSTTFSESTNNINLGLLDPFNPNLDKGNSDYDVRHRVVASGVWSVPGYSKQPGLIGHILGGWQVAPIIEARTGFPFTVWDCSAAVQICSRWDPGTAAHGTAVTANPTAVAGTPNLFNGLPFPVDPATTFPVGAALFNPADINPVLNDAFGSPVPGQFVGTDVGASCSTLGSGRLGPCLYPATMTRRNAFRGPGWWDATFGIYKNFKLTERVGLQFRGEMFNAFNHHNFWVNGSTVDVSQGNFVQLKKGGLGNPNDERRHVQFALKVNF